ncbi:MAG: 30S ribosome-binding factor RbfA [Deltaproteobacteria bacterium]|nr:MAG: 30S ribosome-binding factor RbfA [Deltaproteobacteria bacterium]
MESRRRRRRRRGLSVSRRTERIAGELLAELARLLREEVTDPRVGLVTLTRIDVAPDLSHALVFWSAIDLAPDENRVDERQAGLDSAAPFLRRRIASALTIKRMPELRFRYDPSLVLGTRTLSVLRELEPDEAEGNDGAEG